MRRGAAFAALVGLLLGSLVHPPGNLAKARPGLVIGAVSSETSYPIPAAPSNIRSAYPLRNLAKVRPGLLIGAFSPGTSYPNAPVPPNLRKVRGASYGLTWWTVDGGGYAFSRGDGYALAATIGQPDAGLLRGGDYTLGGGFWAGGETATVDHRIYLPLVTRRS